MRRRENVGKKQDARSPLVVLRLYVGHATYRGRYVMSQQRERLGVEPHGHDDCRPADHLLPRVG